VRARTGQLSVRLRITAGALVVAVGAITVAGMIAVRTIEHEMTSQVDTTLRADADFTRRLLTSGNQLPMAEGPTDTYVQFIDPEGTVVASGTSAHGLSAFAVPGGEPGTITSVNEPALGRLRVITIPAPSDARLTVAIARSVENVAAVRDAMVELLVAMVVGGSGLFCLMVWLVVGRSLRPVEQMRQSVDDLDDRDLRSRVPVPGTQDELDRLARTLNNLLERLEDSVEREHRFVADASHDLRTPLAAVRALLETESSDPALAVLTRADALARLDQLQAVVDQLLTLANADAAAAPPTTAVDLDELVLGQARALARSTHLRVDTSRVSGGQVAGRDTDLIRVIENLASNAVRYAATTISFAVHQFGDTVVLLVDDDGPGIDPADRDRVFERFQTFDDARTHTVSGSGLGLAIVTSIVEAHGGTVSVVDGPGGGACFEVRFPAYQPPSPERPTLAGTVRGLGLAGSDLGEPGGTR